MKNDSKPNFGVLLPTREAVISGRSDPSVLYQLGERAEVLGFHSVWVGDSLTARPRIDALTTLAAVGARTHRVRLGTAIFLAALRHPILLAYQLGSLDWITGGRIDLGVGYGRPKDPTQEHEFEVLGLAPGARMKMSEELVNVMRRLWRENDVSHAGAFTNFEHVTLEPKPVQPGGVPIWLASNNVEPGLKRVGRLRRRLAQQHQEPGRIPRVLGEDPRIRGGCRPRPKFDSSRHLFYFSCRRQRRYRRRTNVSCPILQPILRGGGKRDAVRYRLLG